MSLIELPQKCPVCRQTAVFGWNGAYNVGCPQCGDFSFTASVGHMQDGAIPTDSESDRKKLACILAERWLKGLRGLFIGTSKPEIPAAGRTVMTISELIGEFPKSAMEYFDRALLNLTRTVSHPAEMFTIGPDQSAALFSVGSYFPMVSQLVDIGYIGVVENYSDRFQIKAKGWERAAILESPGRDSRRAFVAMWFNPARKKFFDSGFKPAIEHGGKIEAIRIDLVEHNEHIEDRIVAEIRRSRFLVADATNQNPGVYWEAGFAYGLGLPVIWCVEGVETEDGRSMPQVHFDTRQYKHIVYTDPEDLRTKLLARIQATIPP